MANHRADNPQRRDPKHPKVAPVLLPDDALAGGHSLSKLLRKLAVERRKAEGRDKGEARVRAPRGRYARPAEDAAEAEAAPMAFSPQHVIAIDVLGKLLEARLKARPAGPSLVVVKRDFTPVEHRVPGGTGKGAKQIVWVHRGLDAKTVKALRNRERYAARLAERRRARAA